MSYRSSVGSAVRAFHAYREAAGRQGAARVRAGECRVCLGPHEEEIHIATIRVRRWFRSEVTKGLVRRPGC